MEKWLKKVHNTELNILNYIHNLCVDNDINYFLVGGTLLGAIRHEGFIPWDDDIDIGMTRDDFNKFKKLIAQNSKYFIDYYDNKRYWLLFPKIRLKNTAFVESISTEYKGSKEMWIDIFILDNIDSYEGAKKVEKKLNKVRKYMSYKALHSFKKCFGIRKKIIYVASLLLPMRLLQCLSLKLMCNNDSSSRFLVNYGSKYGVKKQTHLRNKYFPAKLHKFENYNFFIPNDYDYVLRKIYGDNYMELPPIEKRITHNPIYIKFIDGETVDFRK